MRVSRGWPIAAGIHCATVLAALVLFTAHPLAAEEPSAADGSAQLGRDPSRPAPVCEPSLLDSPYIPVDSWVYPATLRLYSLGFVDTVFLGLRPWTRSSLDHILEEAGARIEDADPGPATDEAQDIYEALIHELHFDVQGPCLRHQGSSRIESIYSIERAISGTPLRDSFHLGSTVINDYGRPYTGGFNSYSGASGYASAGRFQLYARGEFQGAPSAPGYSAALVQGLASLDTTTDYFNTTIPLPPSLQTTMPAGPIAAAATGRLIEAYASARVLNHEISFGKQDAWLGPGLGGAFAYSNNAENIYSFRINRIEPLYIPLLSRLTGPFRYDFMIGPLKGHTYPFDPWVHVEKISLRPTENLEFGFQRTVIWGGHGHPCLIPGTVSSTTPCGEPINLHTFLKSFFSFNDTTGAVKLSSDDPGARYSDFYFSWRLPYMHHYVTLYTDSICHDDVTPISAPRRAAYRPGVYISQFPHLPKLDFRIEGANTDTSTTRSTEGEFNYYENVQKQGYTNKGFIMGDWVGRQAKGGQAWLTWHLSGNEWVQAEYRYMKVPRDFVPGGTSQDQLKIELVKRLHKDIELDAWYQYERWKAPVPQITGNNSFNVTGGPLYYANAQTDNVIAAQITWYPKLRSALGLRSK